ncbi:hypothetical protein B9Z55_029043 [Caenorhabditis nigoni]|uniref:Uncharacterized protein n=1 Tax=Caenorhabditis nigoni TaxID=1611254 RepID=A0A2G5S9A8_9PELO|nr:hypothetical protein B9Z55_029043 [Caenorhabditis nigoni]
MADNLRQKLRLHPDGYFIARVVVGLLKIGTSQEVMVLVDPCLCLSDEEEDVDHFAIIGNKLQHRDTGDFQRVNNNGILHSISTARLVQAAVGTWEFKAQIDPKQSCGCHSNFFYDASNHDDEQECSLRKLAGLIANRIREYADCFNMEIPMELTSNLQ